MARKLFDDRGIKNSNGERKMFTKLREFLAYLNRKLIGYGTAFNCMDGKVQGATRKWTKRKRGVRWVDLITQPGMNKFLAEQSNPIILENMREMLWISVKNHRSRNIVIAGHFECLGNPTSQKKQISDLENARETVLNMLRELPLETIDITINDITIDLIWINSEWMPETVFWDDKVTPQIRLAA